MKRGTRKITEVKFLFFQRFLKSLGYLYNRSNGTSHHIFKNDVNRKVCVVSKHKATIHPRTIIQSLNEMEISRKQYSDWLEKQ